MVLRGRNERSGHSRVYTALVSCDGDRPFRPGSPRRLVTLRLAGDDVADYLDIGGHFDLWLGSNVGDGVVTQRSVRLTAGPRCRLMAAVWFML